MQQLLIPLIIPFNQLGGSCSEGDRTVCTLCRQEAGWAWGHLIGDSRSLRRTWLLGFSEAPGGDQCFPLGPTTGCPPSTLLCMALLPSRLLAANPPCSGAAGGCRWMWVRLRGSPLRKVPAFQICAGLVSPPPPGFLLYPCEGQLYSSAPNLNAYMLAEHLDPEGLQDHRTKPNFTPPFINEWCSPPSRH